MKNIKFVTAIHGNERMPTLALAQMGVSQIVGNPKALAINKRYFERDLNSSFGLTGSSYEEKRAREILEEIQENEVVVDFHTFTGKSPAFSIVVDRDMVDFAKSLGIEHVIYMKYSPKKGRALLNFRTGIAVEVGQHDEEAGFDLVQEVVRAIQEGKNKPHPKVKVYEVYGEITKSGDYENFKLCEEGFYPILYSDKVDRKTDYMGLKAKIFKVK